MSKKKKAWSGRFTESIHPLVEAFNQSLDIDRRLYRHDIRGSIAHVRMLARQKIILKKEAAAIVKGLRQIEKEIDEKKFNFDPADEDIHMAIERRLFAVVGDVAGKLHTARSRNDQVSTDVRLYLKERVVGLIVLARRLQSSLVDQAQKHVDTVAPAYTHLQPAQPIRLAHWFLAYYEMVGRDVARLQDALKRIDVMPLGSAALAGTNFPIDREGVARELGFAAITENSLDAVSDRDFVVETLFVIALLATHLSRLAEELILFGSVEFGVMEAPDAFCTGSSIMPQKKNPDVPELVRGKTGRFVGNLMGMLTTLKGLPLAYNKDLQEDKEPLFDSLDQMAGVLEITADMIGALRIDEKRLAEAAKHGYMTAVDIADALVMTGTSFRAAHEIVGKLTRYCLDKGIPYTALTDAELERLDARLLTIDPAQLTPLASTDGKQSYGGTAKSCIVARLGKIERERKEWK